MRAEGTKRFTASREEVYRAAVDPERLMPSIFGVEGVEVVGDAQWLVRVRVPLGLTSLRAKLSVERVEERPPEHARLRGSGRGVGGSVAFDTTFDLADADGGGTDMRYVIELQLGGVAGAAAGRVLQPVLQHQADALLARLERDLSRAADD